MARLRSVASWYVSIRSPHRSEGRSSTDSCRVRRPSRSFNPLPSPKRGEIPEDGQLLTGGQVSIRSPHRSEGRSGAIVSPSTSTVRVSIRSPHRSEGRCCGWRSPTRTLAMNLFQSAPLTEARGDHPQCIYLSHQVVSIRSPHRSEGRCVLSNGFGRIFHVSIRSPHRSEGRSRSSFTSGRTSAFQSAPLTEARGDLDRRRDQAQDVVSIRSPHRSEGRFSIGDPGWRPSG